MNVRDRDQVRAHAWYGPGVPAAGAACLLTRFWTKASETFAAFDAALARASCAGVQASTSPRRKQSLVALPLLPAYFPPIFLASQLVRRTVAFV